MTKQIEDSLEATRTRLTALSKKIDDKRTFIKALGDDDKKLYKNIRERLVLDTHSELTETEYDNISTMMFFCDRFEHLFSNTDAGDIDPDLFNIYRMSKEKITDHLKDYREASKQTPSSIKGIKEYLEKIKTDDGKIIIRAFKKDDEGEIIEIEETSNDGTLPG